MTGSVEFSLNNQNEIVAVGREWDQFALENNAPELVGDKVIGRLVFDFVSGHVTRQFLLAILELVRSGSQPIELEYRCDSPYERRFMKMHVSLMQSGQVCLINSTMRIEKRTQECFITKAVHRSKNTTIRCSMCNLLKCQQEWVEPEHLMALHKHAPSEFIVVYGICKSCSDQLQALQTIQ